MVDELCGRLILEKGRGVPLLGEGLGRAVVVVVEGEIRLVCRLCGDAVVGTTVDKLQRVKHKLRGDENIADILFYIAKQWRFCSIDGPRNTNKKVRLVSVN